MEIRNNSNKAYLCAKKRYSKQKSNDPVYVYRIFVARREMWVVISTAELKAYKISTRGAWIVVCSHYSLSDKELEKMERSANAPERPSELDTSKA